MSPRFRFLFTATLIAVSLVVVGSSFKAPKVVHAGNSDKVTICHRTHSVTNPYRRITVARSSVVNANGHQTASHDAYSSILYPSGKPVPNVFNKSMTYTPAPEKKWGDIIPPVDVSNDDLPGNPELNWSNGAGDLRGIDIYNGTGAYAGICKAVSTADYVRGEKEAGIPTADIKTDLEDQAADEDAAALSTCGGSFASCSLATIESLDTTTTSTVAPTTAAPTTVAPTTTVASAASGAAGVTTTTVAGNTGTLKGIIWIDVNRDGKRDADEPFLKNTKLSITSGTTTLTAYTDENGAYSVANVAPGTWSVVAKLSVKDLKMVYDTTGAADWKATVVVPANGVGVANFAAADKTSADVLPETGTNHDLALSLMALVLLAGGAVIVASRRRIYE